MKTTSTIWLTVERAKNLINKKIAWRAPMDEENWDDYDTPKFYGGECIIRNVTDNNNHPLEVETISGDNLGYAILENEELTPVEGSDTRFSLSPATGDKRTFTYSDLYREVEIIDIKETEVEEDDEDEEHADNILEVMFEGDKTAKSKQFESKLIGLFKMQRLQGYKIQIIKANYDDRTQLSGVYGVDEVKEIERLYISLSAFVRHVSDMIGFEIAERRIGGDAFTLIVTLINESGFKLSATAVED